MESLSNDKLIPIICEKELDIKSFIRGFHEYKTIWMPHKNEVLDARMESTNKKNKFAVAVAGHKYSDIGHFMKQKCERFVKTIFYFLWASEYHQFRVHVTDKAVNQGNDKDMKIPCILIFKGQS